MKKINYNKLIRDKVPDKIRKSGASASYRILKKNEFEKLLVRKTEEEASGLQSAKNKAELIEEMADVIDVLEEIKEIKKISNRQISIARKKNKATKGGFKKRIFLRWTTDTGYRTNEKRYNK